LINYTNLKPKLKQGKIKEIKLREELLTGSRINSGSSISARSNSRRLRVAVIAEEKQDFMAAHSSPAVAYPRWPPQTVRHCRAGPCLRRLRSTRAGHSSPTCSLLPGKTQRPPDRICCRAGQSLSSPVTTLPWWSRSTVGAWGGFGFAG